MDKSILESTYEVGLPEYLQKYLDAYKCVDKELNYFELGTD